MRRRKAKIQSPLTLRITQNRTHRIHWISKITGFTGYGSWISYKSALSNVDYINKSEPRIHHWIESRNNEAKNKRVLRKVKKLYSK